MGESDVVRRLEETRIVAIIRDVSLEHARILGEALVLGGVRAIEVSFTTPDAIPFIERLSGDLGSDIAVGAGTVLDGPTARSAILAGASFVLSPALSPEVIRVCRRYGVPAIPGAMTPTEILSAWEHGASIVKVFPAGRLGPSYIKDIKGPLPQVELMPVGGISLSNAAEFVEAGAVALGIGSALVDRRLVAERNFNAITERARAFVETATAVRKLHR